MLRAEEGNYEEAYNILNGPKQVDINAINKKGYTALSLAIKNGSSDIVRLLLAKGATINTKNNSGQTPLFLACWGNYLEIVKLLLEHGAEVNTTDQRGWSPLTISAYNGNSAIVELLLQNNADVSIQDSFGKRAIHRTKDPKVFNLIQNAELQYEEKLGLASDRSKNRLSKVDSKSNLHIPGFKSISGMPGKKQEKTPESQRKRIPSSYLNEYQESKTPIALKEDNFFCLSSRTPTKLSARNQESPRNYSRTPRNYKENDEKILLDYKEVDEYINIQLGSLSEELQELVNKQAAAEVVKQIQLFQSKLKESLETVITTQISQSLKELRVCFNNHLKSLFAGMNINLHQLAPVELLLKDDDIIPSQLIGKENLTKQLNEIDVKTIQVKIQKEKDIMHKIDKYSTNMNRKGSKSPQDLSTSYTKTSSPLATKHKMRVKRGVKTATETLIDYSKKKVAETAQNETDSFHHSLVEGVKDTISKVQKEAKKKIEDSLVNKFAQISACMGEGSLISNGGSEKSLEDQPPQCGTPPEKMPIPHISLEAIPEGQVSPINQLLTQESEEIPERVIKLKIPEMKYSQFRETGKERSNSERQEDKQEGPEGAGSLSAEYRFDGIKEFYNRAHAKSLVLNNNKGSVNGSPTSARTQKDTSPKVPEHNLSFGSVKIQTVKYDFSDD